MAASYFYGLAFTHSWNANINWDSDTIKCALLTSGYTPNQDTHEFWSDVSANEHAATGNYTAGGETMTCSVPTYTGGTNVFAIDATDVTWSNSTITARYAVVYKDTGTPSTSPLIAYVDFASDQSSSSANFTVEWDTAGVATITVS